MIIDKSYFVGHIAIGQRSQLAVQEKLDFFIEKFEKELLLDVLGYDLYQDLLAGMQEIPIKQKWLDLLDGGTFWRQGEKREWAGLRNKKISVIASYIYYRYMEDIISVATGVGQVQPKGENGNVVYSYRKQVRIWNEMIHYLEDMDYFLRQHILDYPDYKYRAGWRSEKYNRINQLNI